MQVSNIRFTPTQIQPTVRNNKPSAVQNTVQSSIGTFPSYYCPNIAFNGAKFGSIDFEYDFFNLSNKIINNHLDEMELTKGLTEDEQEDFRTNLFSCDKPTLLNFFMDTKPAILLTGEHPYFENNDKYDFVPRILQSPTDTSVVHTPNIFILNKELTKQTIEDNKELYTKRMGFEDDASTDEIYEKLIGEDSPLKEQNGYDDIIGITLGFSPINSILFQLEENIPNKCETRKRSSLHANLLDKEFNSETSPYKEFSDEFKQNVQSKIDFIKTKGFWKPNLYPIGYSYIHLAPDEEFTNRLINESESNYEKAKRIVNNPLA